MSSENVYRAGFIALIGRPNVGKSTLLNQMVGEKVAIVSRKPQTTRHRILAIRHLPDAQLIFVDTPGLHARTPREMNRYLNRTASSALADVDAIIFMVDGLQWTDDDELALAKARQAGAPLLLVVNKVDRIPDKSLLLPHLAKLAEKAEFVEVIPMSARRGTQLDVLEAALLKLMPESPQLFPEEQLTDRSDRFRAAELVREQLMRALGQELPYASTVEIEAMEADGELIRVSAIIWVERPGQKAIVIGKKGQTLKQIGQDARLEMQRLFGCQVYLQLWVKVREGWSDDRRALQSLGYEE
jgi:GTP-binding protein Era